MPVVRVVGDGVVECAEGDTVLRAALRAGLGFPYACNTGSCGTCRFQLLEGAVEHLRADPPAWTERDRERNRWLGCQARPLGDVTVKVRLDPEQVPPHRPVVMEATLVEVTPITHDLSGFAFELEGPDVEAFVDPERLRLVLEAFVEALVWWAREGPIRISAERRDGLIAVRAARRGTELTPERAAELFEPRAPGSGSGSKIGLWVARGVAEAQGGRAGVEIDGGLAFVLELPEPEPSFPDPR